MLGILYVCAALLIFAGLLMEKEGQVKVLVEKFAALNGVGPVFLALFAIFCGMKRLMGYAVFRRNSQILAFPVMYFSLIGFFSAVFPPIGDAVSLGGIVGNYFFWILETFLGSVSAGIVLGALFLVSFMHVTEVYVSDILTSILGFSKVSALKLLRWTLFFSVVLKEAAWFCMRRVHQFLYVLIHDSILLLEKGVRPFGIRIFQPESRVFVAPAAPKDSADEEDKAPSSEPTDESSALFSKTVEVSTIVSEPVPVPENPTTKKSPPAKKRRKKRAITVDVEPPASSLQPDLSLQMENIVEERVLLPQNLGPAIKGDSAKDLSQMVKEESPELVVEVLQLSEESELEELVSVDTGEDFLELEPEPEPAMNKIVPQKQAPLTKVSEPRTELEELLETPKPIAEKKQEESTLKFTGDLPDVGLLQLPPDTDFGDSEDELFERGNGLISALMTYKIEAELQNYVQGPTITRFELSPAPGTKLNRIKALTNEIAMALASKSVRIEAPIPGTSKVGVEIPNENPVPVYFREVIDSISQNPYAHPLTVAFGIGIDGEPVVGNLAKMPHLLVAGATGSGKSVCVNTLISSILFSAGPDKVKFVMIDPKQVELAVYRGIRHLITDVVTNPEEAAAALRWGVEEMEQRYTLLSKFGVRHIDTFNEKLKNGNLTSSQEGVYIPAEPLPYIVIIVDELADLMMVARKDVETSICRIAQKARAVGIHLVIATQRPSVDVITGLIKANLPSRIAFMVNSGTDSRTILNHIGAESLLGRGDMLYFPAGQNKPDRVQGAFMTDDEVAKLVEQVKHSYGEADYQDIVSSHMETEEVVEEDGDFFDEKMEAALEVALREKYVSTSMLQRHLGVGYNRAARMVDSLFARGICGPAESGKKRKILVTVEQAWEMISGC
jgi:DNA segregation ATPase FtsK/SpoIIIE-like protein